jgi:fermentation-respiration switch protein FrsA (DUF1100 family)
MKDKKRPTVREIVGLPLFGPKPYVSPDCTRVIFLKGLPNLKKNSLDVEGYIYNIESKKTNLLFTNCRNIKWFDSDSICCLKSIRDSETMQIHIFQDLIGEPIQVTSHPHSIQSFEVFGDGFVFVSSSEKHRSPERIGNFKHVESEVPTSGLFYVHRKKALASKRQSVQTFKEEQVKEIPSSFEITHLLEEPLAIDSYVVSPSTNTIYLNCQIKSDSFFENNTKCFRIDFNPDSILSELESKNLDDALSSAKLVKLALPKSYKVREVSPDGKKILLTGRDVEAIPETRPDLWLLDVSMFEDELNKQGLDKNLKCITKKLDRQALDVVWNEQGIFIVHWEESRQLISKLDELGEFETYSLGDVCAESYLTMNDRGYIGILGYSPTKLKEIYYGTPDTKGWILTKITTETEDYSHLDFGTVESIKWKSKDGTEIEGVLRKPSDFDPNKKYPLIVLPHGGPRSSSPYSLLVNQYFQPVHSFLARGILILQPNYRGGLGKGKTFMELNHNNMGVGDMWDIESGIDYLISKGFVDEDRIGSMGGSQGGYLSAFGGMHTDRFAAVNVMAGVSSWYIYFIGSDNRHDIHITGTPYDPESRNFYKKSAPIAAIDRAKTPMLIQHGEEDERISVISAKELYRALKHKGVPVELFTYPGKGHGFIAPQENYAMMLQVYRWFCHYLLGEELDFFRDDF